MLWSRQYPGYLTQLQLDSVLRLAGHGHTTTNAVSTRHDSYCTYLEWQSNDHKDTTNCLIASLNPLALLNMQPITWHGMRLAALER